MPDWLRWILVLPASIGAYFGIQLVVGIASEFIDLPWFIPSDWENVYQDWASQGVNSIVSPIALIYAGARTAPRTYRFQTSIALAVLFGVITGGLVAISLTSTQKYHPQWWLLTTTVASIITVIVVCIHIQRTEVRNVSFLSEG